jgi:hypothetical protein
MNDYRPIGIDTAINMLSMLFGQPYYIPGDKETKQIVDRYNVSIKVEETPERLSQYGTPVFGTFWAIPDDLPYYVYGVDGRLTERQFNKFEFPIATVVDFSRPKLSVKEKTNGGFGTVKETMGLDDWQISIRGLIVNDDSREFQKTVKQQQYALDALSEITGAIKVEGEIFRQRNITHIYLDDLRYTTVQGKPGLIQYEIPAVSDVSFLLTGL